MEADPGAVELAFQSSVAEADVVHVGEIAAAVVEPDAGVERVEPVPHEIVAVFVPSSVGILHADVVFARAVGIEAQHLEAVVAIVVVPVVLPVGAAEVARAFAVFQ